MQLAVQPTIEVVGVSAGEGQEDPTKVSVLEGPEDLTGLTLYRRGGRKKFARLLRLQLEELPGGDPSRKALYGFLACGH